MRPLPESVLSPAEIETLLHAPDVRDRELHRPIHPVRGENHPAGEGHAHRDHRACEKREAEQQAESGVRNSTRVIYLIRPAQPIRGLAGRSLSNILTTPATQPQRLARPLRGGGKAEAGSRGRDSRAGSLQRNFRRFRLIGERGIVVISI